EALPEVLRTHPKVTCLWVGEGLYREQIEARIADLGLSGRVRLTGRRPDVPTLLLAADLFVFPTRFEGFPFSLLEAAAHELPIVTTSASSIPEFLTDGIDARVVPVNDRSAMESALIHALAHPETMTQWARVARKRVENFTDAHMIEKTLATLDRLSGRESL